MIQVDFECKIIAEQALEAALARLARPIVLTNGVFDILHRGHVTYLSRARALGASLIVAVNSDHSVKLLGKGDDRPVNSEVDRAAVVAALQSVDLVTIFIAQIPLSIVQAVRPDIYVKGGDYDMERIAEARLARSLGARTIAIPFVHDRSTTQLLRRLRGG